MPKIGLSTWVNTMSSVLKHSSIYRATTNGVEVSVIPVFCGVELNKDRQKEWMWYNMVIITNRAESAVQIFGRELRETDGSGPDETATRISMGRGLLGTVPLIRPNDSFHFNTPVRLQQPQGTTSGLYNAAMVCPEKRDCVLLSCPW